MKLSKDMNLKPTKTWITAVQIEEYKHSALEIKKLANENNSLQKENKTLAFNLNSLQDNTIQLETKLKAISDEKIKTDKQKSDLETKLNTVSEEKTNLEKKTHTENNKLKKENDELQKENELIILQLHQLQEEFEKNVLDNKKKETDLKELEKKLTDSLKELTKQKASSDKFKSELEAKLKAISDEKIKTDKQKSDLETKLNTVSEEKTNLEKKTHSENNKLKEENDELQKENELIILQLHQLQEEFELKYCRISDKYDGNVYTQISAPMLFSLLPKQNPFRKTKVKIKLIDNKIHAESNLPNDKHQYFYCTRNFLPEELNFVFNKSFKLLYEGDCDLRTVFVYLNEKGEKISHNILAATKEQSVNIPKGCKSIRMALRFQGSGKAIIHKLSLCSV